MSWIIYINSKPQIALFPLFKVTSLSLLHFLMLLCQAFMRCKKNSFGMAISTVVTVSLMAYMPSKRVSLMISLSVGDCSSWSGTTQCSDCCGQVHYRYAAATICSATTLVSSCALNEAYTIGSPCRLVDWSSGAVVRTRCEQYLSHWKMWSTWLSLAIFGFSDVHRLLWCLVFGPYSKMHVSLPVMTSDSVWRCSMMSYHTCALSDHHLAVLALLRLFFFPFFFCRVFTCPNLRW